MGCRALLLIFVFGGILCLFGWTEYRLARGASDAPEAITIEELEKGVPSNPHRTIGEHVPIDALVVYSYGKKSGKISFAYYPIVSRSSLAAAREKALKKAGSADRIKGEDIQSSLDIKVVVKTNRWTTPAELKAAMDKDAFPTRDLTGMVVNEVSSLSTSEKDMLKEKYRAFDESRVVIFEVGRAPTSTTLALGTMAGGGALILLGLVLAIKGRSRAAA